LYVKSGVKKTVKRGVNKGVRRRGVVNMRNHVVSRRFFTSFVTPYFTSFVTPFVLTPT
jgi:hypothetical protein